jgi:predicted Zn-ribbon and HTH transcriptional regulator
MNRPTLEVADIFRAKGDSFIDQNQTRISYQQLKVMRAITRCRTAALGGHVDRCTRCGHQAISFNSCRNRHCPKCQAQTRQRWLADRERELLATSYFHVVFTLPHELEALVQRNQSLLYSLLFRMAAVTLLEVAADPKHLGAEIGFFAVLHTWGSNLMHHPHVHCAIPAGGLAPDHSHWIRPRYPFFLPVKVLSRVFRGKFVAALRRAFRRRQLEFGQQFRHLTEPKHFAAFLRTLFRKDWVVYAKPAFGGPTQVLRYLGRYTHRVAISNHRLVDFDGSKVTFLWRDYAHGNRQRKMTLAVQEFVRRFLLHVLPPGFVRIRNFGFLANRHRALLLPLCRQLLAMEPLPGASHATKVSDRATWQCPLCHGTMVTIERFTAAQFQRSNWPCAYYDSS